jgi:RNA polymerase sigma factor (sigma-70 family)
MRSSPVLPSAEQNARTYGPLVSSVYRRMLRDPDAARDVAQEAWLQILKKSALIPGEARLSTWIFTVTRRQLARHARRDQMYSTHFRRDECRPRASAIGSPQPAIRATPTDPEGLSGCRPPVF